MIPRPWVLPLLVASGAAALLGAGALGLLLALIVATSEISRFLGLISLRGVTYERTLPEDHAFVGDTIAMSVSIANRKLAPVPWAEFTDEMPDAVDIAGLDLQPSSQAKRQESTVRFGFAPFERVTRTYTVQCLGRGHHEFGPARARSGDIFGFIRREATFEERSLLVVYPRLLDIQGPPIAGRRPVGELRTADRRFEDATRIRALRQYEPGDPLKRIDWKATARSGRVQVREYDPSASHDLYVAVNVSTFEAAWQGVRVDVLETCISVAATLASNALRDGRSAGVLANGCLPGSDQPLRVPPSRGSGQLPRMLGGLAGLNAFAVETIEASVGRARRSMPWTASLIVVTGFLSADLISELEAMRHFGRPVGIVFVGDDAPEAPGNLRVWHVPPGADHAVLE